jgi:hypothetical protein
MVTALGTNYYNPALPAVASATANGQNSLRAASDCTASLSITAYNTVAVTYNLVKLTANAGVQGLTPGTVLDTCSPSVSSVPQNCSLSGSLSTGDIVALQLVTTVATSNPPFYTSFICQ